MKESGELQSARMPMRGVVYGLLASLLFGLSTPISKSLLGRIDPLLLAGMFYLGSGVGLVLCRFVFARLQSGSLRQPKLRKSEWKFLAPAIVAGGVLAPALL